MCISWINKKVLWYCWCTVQTWRSFNLCSYSSLQVVPGYRHWSNVNFDLHEVPHEKFYVGQIWRSWSSGTDHPRPNHRSGNVDTCLWIRGGGKSCWKSAFRFPSSDWVIKRNSSTTVNNSSNYVSFFLKKKRPHCLSELRPPKILSSACPLRVSPALRFSTPSKNEILLRPWNTFVTGMLVVAECWTTLTSLQRYTLSYSVVCCNIIAENKSISEFPHTALVYSSHGYATSRLPSTSLASLPKENYCFHTYTLTEFFPLQTQAVFTNVS